MADERSDIAVLTVQALRELRRMATELEADGHQRSDVDREIRKDIANLVPAVRESLRLEMTGDEISRWLR